MVVAVALAEQAAQVDHHQKTMRQDKRAAPVVEDPEEQEAQQATEAEQAVMVLEVQ